MSLMQINRINIRRMNQIPIYVIQDLKDITERNKKEETKKMVQSILYDMIDLIETNHNFEYIDHTDVPKNKNILKRLFKATKKIFS